MTQADRRSAGERHDGKTPSDAIDVTWVVGYA